MSINVLIVDDSAFFRKRLLEILSAIPDVKVVGGAANGREAIDAVTKLNPDVITMDYEMPVMDGVTAVREIMSMRPTPILMFSSLTYEGARVTLDALEAGAVDFLPKTFADVSGDASLIKAELGRRIKSIHQAHASSKPQNVVQKLEPEAIETEKQVEAKTPVASQTSQSPLQVPLQPPLQSPINRSKEGDSASPRQTHSASASGLQHPIDLLMVGSSTGGPVAIQTFLTVLPREFPVPILLIQHMPATFTKPFAERLNSLCQISVKEAEDGDQLLPGHAYLAPGAKQMLVNPRAANLQVNIIEGDHGITYKPSVDITFGSGAKRCPERTLGVVLTGMGSDGREGCRLIKQQKGTVWTQSEASCVIYGMPAVVDRAGYSDQSIEIDQLADKLLRRIG